MNQQIIRTFISVRTPNGENLDLRSYCDDLPVPERVKALMSEGFSESEAIELVKGEAAHRAGEPWEGLLGEGTFNLVTITTETTLDGVTEIVTRGADGSQTPAHYEGHQAQGHPSPEERFMVAKRRAAQTSEPGSK